MQTGIYKYSRHPQYFGFLLVIVGWVIVWPSLLTIALSPILIFSYIKFLFFVFQIKFHLKPVLKINKKIFSLVDCESIFGPISVRHMLFILHDIKI